MIDSYNRKIHYLRISVTDLCNMRCQYCMPPEGVKLFPHEDILSFEEIFDITKIAVDMGVNKVRLTGGEPLVRKEIITLVAMLREIEGINDYAMTTNGTLLKKFAQPLKDAGLDRLNISLDSLNPAEYKKITRGGNLQHVLEGINAAREAGFENIKINCVVEQSPDEENAKSVIEYAKKNGFFIRFIRKMSIKDGRFWSVLGGDGGVCEKCNRLRLSSVGEIYPCLFNDIKFSVKKMGIEQALKMAINNKPEAGQKSNKNEFYSMGG
jgi:GTP 3',8-cyclase